MHLYIAGSETRKKRASCQGFVLYLKRILADLAGLQEIISGWIYWLPFVADETIEIPSNMISDLSGNG